MDKFTIAIGFLLSLQLLLRGLRLQKLPVPRMVLSIVLLGLAYWVGSIFFYAVVGTLASWFVSYEVGGFVDPLREVRKGLASGDPVRVDGAVREAQEMATDKALGILIDHLATVAMCDDRKNTLMLMHTIVDGWGFEKLFAHWAFLPAPAREKCLEALLGKTGFPVDAALRIARNGMEDEGDIAAAGWRTYASIVTAGFEAEQTEFDAQAWLRESAEDSHVEVQGLRTHLEQKRLVEVQDLGVESLVSRYRREVFIQPSASTVQFRVTEDYELTGEVQSAVRLPAGTYTGTLSGKFDNAQNAVAEGWRFHLRLEDVGGETWDLTSIWFSTEFFAEILDERYDGARSWFDDAPATLDHAFANQAFVGPVVAYGDTWNSFKPTIDGEALALGGQQLLKCLIAIAPNDEVGEPQLSFLLYGVEDGANEGDWLQPFVTTIPLERWILSAALDEVIEPPVVKIATL
ncbi:MAG: hypothetical protein P8N31_11455 [Planctomycetota bacterium]|nr:hypothetical protein [Planctomycetota bacterium]